MFFSLHEWIGFVVIVLAGVRFMELAESEVGWKGLYPWLDSPGRRALSQQIREVLPCWLRGQLRTPEEQHLIAATAHGLGLGIAFLLGLTGSIVFTGMEPDGSMAASVKMVMNVHQVLGTLMWVYLFGHGGMALAHQWAGQRAFQRIFSLKSP
jgi:cytochrome b561